MLPMQWQLLASWFDFTESSRLPDGLTFSVQDVRSALQCKETAQFALQLLHHLSPQKEQQRELQSLVSNALMREDVHIETAMRVSLTRL